MFLSYLIAGLVMVAAADNSAVSPTSASSMAAPSTSPEWTITFHKNQYCWYDDPAPTTVASPDLAIMYQGTSRDDAWNASPENCHVVGLLESGRDDVACLSGSGAPCDQPVDFLALPYIGYTLGGRSDCNVFYGGNCNPGLPINFTHYGNPSTCASIEKPEDPRADGLTMLSFQCHYDPTVDPTPVVYAVEMISSTLPLSITTPTTTVTTVITAGTTSIPFLYIPPP